MLVPFLTPWHEGSRPITPTAAKKCHCTIIPPHISEKVRDSEVDPTVSEAAYQALQKHQELRGRRARLFEGYHVMTRLPISPDGTVKVYDAGNKEDLPGSGVATPSTSSDDEVEEAYKWAIKTAEFYSKMFSRNSIDGQGMRIVSTVHYGTKYDNAFWDGEQMVYGCGDGKYFNRFTIDCDVTGHELTHGVTQFDVDLRYEGQSGALNESLSDAFGSMVKQYILDQNVQEASWLIGEQLMIGEGYSLRSMKAPGTAYRNHPALGDDPQPDSMDKYDPTKEDNGGVHINSGIPNRAFYLAAQKLYEVDSTKYARSWSGAGRVWYEAKSKVPSEATFTQFADETIKQADIIFGRDTPASSAIRYAWAEVKVPLSSSNRVFCSLF